MYCPIDVKLVEQSQFFQWGLSFFHKYCHLHFHVSCSDSPRKNDIYQTKMKAAVGNPEDISKFTYVKRPSLDQNLISLRKDTLLAQAN